MIDYQPNDIKEAILSRISEEEIFSKYVKNYKKLGKFSSEFRNDPTPSCSIRNYGKKVIYKDFGENESYDCFSYIMRKYNVKYMEALEIIYNDFKPVIPFRNKLNFKEKQQTDTTHIIKIKTRNIEANDLEFWSKYNINIDILQKFQVYPIKYYISNSNESFFIRYPTPGYSYAYYFGKNSDGNEEYKIYRPFSGDRKWRSNCTKETILGLLQLPQVGNLLIITSSLKDVMSLYSINCRYNAIAPQSETTIISADIIEKLRKRFCTIVTLMDNDEAGLKSMIKYKELYGFNNIILSKKLGAKDPSDLIKLHGINELQNFMRDAI